MPRLVDTDTTSVDTGRLVPFWVSGDGVSAKLYHGHVVSVLGGLPSRSVHCVVTSPPYW